MKDAILIIKEIKELETRLACLKAELLNLQETCEHAYASDPLMSTCSHCMKTEIHYY